VSEYEYTLHSPHPPGGGDREQLTALQAAWADQQAQPVPPTMAQHLHRFAGGTAEHTDADAEGVVYQILMSLPWDGQPAQHGGITTVSFFPDGSMAGCRHDRGHACQFRPVYLSRGFDRWKPRFSPYAQGPAWSAHTLPPVPEEA